MWANANLTHSSYQRSTWQPKSRFRQFLERLPQSVRGRAIARFDEWRRRRALLAELVSMSDRDLADLGITRGDFPAILDGTYRCDGEGLGTSADEEQRPFTFARWAEEDSQPAPKSPTPDFAAAFFPFWSRPSWFERYWYGDNKADERLW
jgi:uncharacterized protein YjiS (DUF1127 family)